jgi:hypothetical protein
MENNNLTAKHWFCSFVGCAGTSTLSKSQKIGNPILGTITLLALGSLATFTVFHFLGGPIEFDLLYLELGAGGAGVLLLTGFTASAIVYNKEKRALANSGSRVNIPKSDSKHSSSSSSSEREQDEKKLNSSTSTAFKEERKDSSSPSGSEHEDPVDLEDEEPPPVEDSDAVNDGGDPNSNSASSEVVNFEQTNLEAIPKTIESGAAQYEQEAANEDNWRQKIKYGSVLECINNALFSENIDIDDPIIASLRQNEFVVKGDEELADSITWVKLTALEQTDNAHKSPLGHVGRAGIGYIPTILVSPNQGVMGIFVNGANNAAGFFGQYAPQFFIDGANAAMQMAQEGDKGLAESFAKAALAYLKGVGAAEKMSFRERHYNFKWALRRVLGSDYYMNNRNDASDSLVQFAEGLSYVYYTQVNRGDQTRKLTKNELREQTNILAAGEKPKGCQDPLGEPTVENMERFLSHERLEYNHKLVKNNEPTPQKIRGELEVLGLDPSQQGNPPNVKAKVLVIDGNKCKVVVDVRTPTPTLGDSTVNPEFKAFLRALKKQRKHYSMVNLQNRTNPGAIADWCSRSGECNRSENLEKLAQDDEFKDVIKVITLDKNSNFYFQKEEHSAGEQTAKDFIDNFMAEINKPDGGFSLIPTISEEVIEGAPISAKVIEGALNDVHRTVFGRKDVLSHSERENFIELAYLLITAEFVRATDADFFNQSCKDCIDRGGGANWLMLATLTLFETYATERNSVDFNRGLVESGPSLAEKIAVLPEKMEEDALWARKRGIIHERLERAMGAFHTLVDLAKNNSQGFEEFMDLYPFKSATFNL